MNEPELILLAIRDALEPTEWGGPVELRDGQLSLKGGQLTLQARVHQDEGTHLAIAHAHIIAKIQGYEPLDACVVAVHVNRTQGLRQAGQRWVDLVAGPVLSLVEARPMLGAVHFAGASAVGVRGAHGFVGNRGCGTTPRPEDAGDPFPNTEPFAFASALAPPGTLHIAKVVLDASTGGPTRRILEIDGHAASHTDPEWHPVPDAPLMGIQYAVFH